MKPDQFLVQRLCDLIWLPGGEGEGWLSLWRRTTLKQLLEHPPISEYIDENLRMSKDDLLRHRAMGEDLPESIQGLDEDWDLGRARYFYDQIVAGRSLDPISVDNQCNHGHIYAVPVLIDGHHRLGASLIGGARTIPVHYGGRCDLKAYLTGRRKTCPMD